MKTQYEDWTIDDFSVEDIKRTNIPNWLRAGYFSKSEAIDAVINIVKKEEHRFAALGLVGPIVKVSKKKK